MATILFDLETTGLKPEAERIIEVAFLNVETGASLVSFVHPQRPIPYEAQTICNITDAMVAQAPPFEQIIDQICQFCPEGSLLVAHNGINFDSKFLQEEFQRCARTLPNWRIFDTLHWVRRFRPDLPKYSLQYLRDMCGIPANQAHRALDDVHVMQKVCEILFDDLSWEQAYKMLSLPQPTLQTMPFGKHQGTPFAQVPKNYLQWLAKSGALDKEENSQLKERLSALGLIG